jgi:tripartite ATP-independent transporter DctM subunit
LSVRRNYPRRTHSIGFSEAVKCTRDALIALVMPLIIIAGIVLGVFTPTEAAAVAVCYAFIVGLLAFRLLSPRGIVQAIWGSAMSSGRLFYVIACVGILSWAFAMEDVPGQVVAVFSGFTESPRLVLLFINIFLLFMGMWLDLTANIFLFAPIFGPLVDAVGINPIHFSMIFLLNVNLGNITPPLGIILFATSELSRENVVNILKDLWPFWIIKAVVLALVTYVPWISLYIPRIVGFLD